LLLMFRLRPTFEKSMRDLPDGHREYELVCTITHRITDVVLGQGVGCCSTLESKYRWRRGQPETTGQIIPPLYWKLRKTKPAKAQELLGGKEMVARKIEGQWFICRKADVSERFPNPDIADCYNTVFKVAKKRALVDSVLTCTAASDVFTHPEEE